ncbi:MAG: APC family permease [Alphaproteobacteria bacterium]|nr:APC family permease [Alphaproteobacteria bacterium]MBV9694022.1 APC family permease [Alphaproteobacteria bacterium]
MTEIASTPTATAASRPALGFLDTALYMLAAGVGIRWIAVAAAVGPASLPLWLLALIVFYLPLAVAVAELTGRHPGEGGIYAWVRDEFGPLAGFICGWFYWFALMPYFAGILYFLGGLILAALGHDPKDTLAYIAIAAAISLLVTAMQAAGLKYGKWLPNIGMTGGWIVVLIIVAMGVVIGVEGRSATDFAHAAWLAPASFPTAILWGTIVFAFSGAESAAFLRSEIKGGLKTIVAALAIVGVASVFVYGAGTASFLAILPQGELTRLGGFADALKTGLVHLGLGRFVPIVIGLFAFSMLGGFTAWFGVGARLPFAAGIDAFLPKVFARRNPKTGAPVPAILLQAGLMFAVVLLSQAGSSVAGAYDILVNMAVLGSTVPYLFMFAAQLRAAGRPQVAGGWTPPGGKRTSVVLGWLGLLSSAVAILCTLAPDPNDAHAGLTFLKIAGATALMLAAGLALYGTARWRART